MAYPDTIANDWLAIVVARALKYSLFTVYFVATIISVVIQFKNNSLSGM